MCSQHLENIKPHVESGLVVLGGASLDEPLQEGQPPKINGSVMMAEADTADEVWKWVRNDIYYTTGVWDTEKVRVSNGSCHKQCETLKANTRPNRSKSFPSRVPSGRHCFESSINYALLS